MFFVTSAILMFTTSALLYRLTHEYQYLGYIDVDIIGPSTNEPTNDVFALVNAVDHYDFVQIIDVP